MLSKSRVGLCFILMGLAFLMAPCQLHSQEATVETDASAEIEKTAESKNEESAEQNGKSKKDNSQNEDSSQKKDSESKQDASKAEAKNAEDKKEDDKDGKKVEKKETKKDEEKEEKKTQVRVLPLSGEYVDKVQPGSFDPTSILLGSTPVKQKSFYRLCEYLQEIAKDDQVEFIVFDLSDALLGMNSAQLDEFTRRMDKLKASGKKTFAWLENASNEHITIAACCNEVYVADFGSIDMPSVAMNSMYYRDAMDLVGVKASVVRAGEFKGAVEPYTNAVMSSHLKQHYMDMLTTLNDARVSRIAKGRGLTTAKVRELQKRRFLTPSEALAAGLVDKLAPFGSIRKTIDDSIGKTTEWSTPSGTKKKDMSFFEFMSMVMSGPKATSSRIKDNTIAVMHLSGTILDGKSGSSNNIVSGPIVKTIKTLTDEDKIKGVVVRINSPGGSATASESIRQALQKLADKKPIVISMGDVAASGGYWVSCLDDVPIYAERATVTGSIGVFSMKLSFGSLMRRVGVTLETMTLDDSAAAFSIDRPWTDSDMEAMKRTIDMFYDRFLTLVVDARNMPLEKVEPLAGGRVWSGTQAKATGLVDEIGGLDDCLAVVAKKAKIDDYTLIHRPTGGSGLSLIDLLGDSDDDEISGQWFRSAVQVLKARGFSFDVLNTLLKDGTNRKNGMPTIWLLNPAEFAIQ